MSQTNYKQKRWRHINLFVWHLNRRKSIGGGSSVVPIIVAVVVEVKWKERMKQANGHL